VYLLEWPLPVTVFAAIGCWVGGRGTRAAAAYVLALAGVLFFYFHRDTLFGPWLLFSAVPAVLVLVAGGMVGLADARRRLGASIPTAPSTATAAHNVTAALRSYCCTMPSPVTDWRAKKFANPHLSLDTFSWWPPIAVGASSCMCLKGAHWRHQTDGSAQDPGAG
jgi:heme A synthase